MYIKCSKIKLLAQYKISFFILLPASTKGTVPQLRFFSYKRKCSIKVVEKVQV